MESAAVYSAFRIASRWRHLSSRTEQGTKGDDGKRSRKAKVLARNSMPTAESVESTVTGLKDAARQVQRKHVLDEQRKAGASKGNGGLSNSLGTVSFNAMSGDVENVRSERKRQFSFSADHDQCPTEVKICRRVQDLEVSTHAAQIHRLQVDGLHEKCEIRDEDRDGSAPHSNSWKR